MTESHEQKRQRFLELRAKYDVDQLDLSFLKDHYISDYEIMILHKVLKGKASRDIAEELNRSPFAINNYRRNIRKKLYLEKNTDVYLMIYEHHDAKQSL